MASRFGLLLIAAVKDGAAFSTDGSHVEGRFYMAPAATVLHESRRSRRVPAEFTGAGSESPVASEIEIDAHGDAKSATADADTSSTIQIPPLVRSESRPLAKVPVEGSDIHEASPVQLRSHSRGYGRPMLDESALILVDAMGQTHSSRNADVQWQKTSNDTDSDEACVDISGTYVGSGGASTSSEFTLTQIGCSGNVSTGRKGWTYIVRQCTVVISGNAGTITGTAGSYKITWSTGRTWTEKSEKAKNEEVTYQLLKSNHECKSMDTDMGQKSSVEGCAWTVIRNGGRFFIYGKKRKSNRCYAESTTSAACPEGWEADDYDFYEAKAAGPRPSSASGVQCSSSAPRGSWTRRLTTTEPPTTTTVAAVNCKWSYWTTWSYCTETCGGGDKERTRSIWIQPSNGGDECVGPPEESSDCNLDMCPTTTTTTVTTTTHAPKKEGSSMLIIIGVVAVVLLLCAGGAFALNQQIDKKLNARKAQQQNPLDSDMFEDEVVGEDYDYDHRQY